MGMLYEMADSVFLNFLKNSVTGKAHILMFIIFELKSLFISGEFNIPVSFFLCLFVAVKKHSSRQRCQPFVHGPRSLVWIIVLD